MSKKISFSTVDDAIDCKSANHVSPLTTSILMTNRMWFLRVLDVERKSNHFFRYIMFLDDENISFSRRWWCYWSASQINFSHRYLIVCWWQRVCHIQLIKDIIDHELNYEYFPFYHPFLDDGKYVIFNLMRYDFRVTIHSLAIESVISSWRCYESYVNQFSPALFAFWGISVNIDYSLYVCLLSIYWYCISVALSAVANNHMFLMR